MDRLLYECFLSFEGNHGHFTLWTAQKTLSLASGATTTAWTCGQGMRTVYAMMPGEVVKVSFDNVQGNYVTIRHGDYTVSYCHLSKTLVKRAHKSCLARVVAISGNTGRSTGPHLHITAKYGKKHIDPAILLQFVRETRAEAWAHLVADD